MELGSGRVLGYFHSDQLKWVKRKKDVWELYITSEKDRKRWASWTPSEGSASQEKVQSTMLNVDSLCKEGIVTPELNNVEIITGIDNGFLRRVTELCVGDQSQQQAQKSSGMWNNGEISSRWEESNITEFILQDGRINIMVVLKEEIR